MANFVWYGGELILKEKDFYEYVLKCQNKYNIKVCNYIQTDGVLLEKDIVDFLVNNKFFIGVSLDGYEKLHVNNRKIINKDFIFICN